MELFFRKYRTARGTPLVILHGLLGSGTNWHGFAQRLSTRRTIYALDLRNHGRSPHLEEQSYAAMSKDLQVWCEQQKINSMILLGHSMSGKVAMNFACEFPNRIHQLIVVDVKPFPILRDLPVLSAMSKLKLNSIKNYGDAERKLIELGLNPELSRFAITNLVKGTEGFFWRVNLPTLINYESHIMRTGLPEGRIFEGTTDFLLGEKSVVVSPSEYPKIKEYFPNAKFTIIPGSGHNPHIEVPVVFLDTVRSILVNS